jgi:hypothetical protein
MFIDEWSASPAMTSARTELGRFISYEIFAGRWFVIRPPLFVLLANSSAVHWAADVIICAATR